MGGMKFAIRKSGFGYILLSQQAGLKKTHIQTNKNNNKKRDSEYSSTALRAPYSCVYDELKKKKIKYRRQSEAKQAFSLLEKKTEDTQCLCEVCVGGSLSQRQNTHAHTHGALTHQYKASCCNAA